MLAQAGILQLRFGYVHIRRENDPTRNRFPLSRKDIFLDIVDQMTQCLHGSVTRCEFQGTINDGITVCNNAVTAWFS